MTTNPFIDTAKWLDGSEMPQQVVDSISKKFRLAYFPLSAVIMLFGTAVTAVMIRNWIYVPDFRNDPGECVMGVFIIILIWFAGVFFLRGGIRHLRFLKNREFVWLEGVTSGIFHTPKQGNSGIGIFVKTESSPVMTKNFTLSGASIGYKDEGIPVYSVMFNINGRDYFKGGFLRDPLLFKKSKI